MDLASPLRSIAPGLDSAVLQVLAGTESALSASQIARLAPRGSRAGQLPVLNRLVEHGLVSADPANHGYLYRLNRDHILAEAVLTVTSARATIVRRLTRAVGELSPEPIHVSVFGSFARGQAGPNSDIDLLIVTSTDAELGEEWTDQVHALADKVLAWTGNRLEHLVLTLHQLREVVEAGESIVASWLDEAHTLSGTTLDSLVRDVTPTLADTRGSG